MSNRANINAVFAGLVVIILGAAAVSLVIAIVRESRGSGDDDVKLTVLTCDTIARGEVENTTDQTLDVYIRVEFVDRKGTTINLGTAYIEWLKPGAMSYWSVPYGGVRDYDTCHAEVGFTTASKPPVIEDIEIP